ncbi:unnamed protein product [Symbiodinium natans]|uniref:Uncharacterized protein n=1 Tax=Symbiodinium natans TaxID=878477 RepID=A0A812LRC2_9DINO|nr:unnamed protein product [Symbiodinium natans]
MLVGIPWPSKRVLMCPGGALRNSGLQVPPGPRGAWPFLPHTAGIVIGEDYTHEPRPQRHVALFPPERHRPESAQPCPAVSLQLGGDRLQGSRKKQKAQTFCVAGKSVTKALELGEGCGWRSRRDAGPEVWRGDRPSHERGIVVLSSPVGHTDFVHAWTAHRLLEEQEGPPKRAGSNARRRTAASPGSASSTSSPSSASRHRQTASPWPRSRIAGREVRRKSAGCGQW